MPRLGLLLRHLRLCHPAFVVPSRSSFQTTPPPCSPPHALQALARLCLYKWLPPEEMPESPDAVFFPGKPAAGVQPLAGTVTRYLNGNKAGTYWQAVGLWGLAGQVSSGWLGGDQNAGTRLTVLASGSRELRCSCPARHSLQVVTVTLPADVVTRGAPVVHLGGYQDSVGVSRHSAGGVSACVLHKPIANVAQLCKMAACLCVTHSDLPQGRLAAPARAGAEVLNEDTDHQRGFALWRCGGDARCHGVQSSMPLCSELSRRLLPSTVPPMWAVLPQHPTGRISLLSLHPGPGILYITVKGGQNFGQIPVQISGGIIEAAYYLVRLGGLMMAGHSWATLMSSGTRRG